MHDGFKVHAEVAGDGSLTVRGTPFAPGARVEVTVRPSPAFAGEAYGLRGLPLRYDAPFAPATDDADWDALS